MEVEEIDYPPAVSKGVELLRSAQLSMRMLLAESAAGGDDHGLVLLAGWVEELGRLIGQTSTLEGRRSAKPSGYPRFVRDGDYLVKVGWSRGDRAEYRHRAPKAALASLLNALTRCHRQGQRFVMETMLNDGSLENEQIPGYQAYLCLAWLREEKLIVQHGRQGYSLAIEGDLQAEVFTRWIHLQADESSEADG